MSAFSFIRNVVCKPHAFNAVKSGKFSIIHIKRHPNVGLFRNCAANTTISRYESKWNRNGERCKQMLQRTVSVFAVVTAIEVSKLKEGEETDEKKRQEVEKEELDDQLIMLLKRAKLAESRDQLADAEDYYQKALEHVIKCSIEEAMPERRLLDAKVYIHDALANLAFNQQKFDSAEVMFKETLRGLLQQGYSQTDNAVVEISLKLAMIYVMMQKFDLADHGYQYCIQTQKEKIKELQSKEAEVDDDTFALLGLTVDSYARYLLLREKFKDALKFMDEAIQIAEKVLGEFHQQVAVLYNDKTTILMTMKQYGEAKKTILKAIDVAKKAESEDIASLLCNYGTVCIYNNELKLAKEQCQKAHKIVYWTKNDIVKNEAKKCLDEIKRREKIK